VLLRSAVRVICEGAARSVHKEKASWRVNSERLIRVGFFVVMFGAHCSLQGQAWRIHLGEVAAPSVIADPWAILSLPLFALVPRHLWPVYFENLQFVNSLIWAAAATWLITFLPLHRLHRRRDGRHAVPIAKHAGLWQPPRGSGESGRAGAWESPEIRVHGGAQPPQVMRTFGNGRYEVLARIGGGGFSAVYRARDRVRGLEVAIKALDLRSMPAAQRAGFRAAFQQEASLAGRLDHHGIVAVLDHDASAEEPYIVMSLISAGTLRQWLDVLPRGKHIEWPEVVEIGTQVAGALDYARRRGVQAHRDIKPANIFRGDSGYKVGDFGIVRARVGDASPVTAGGTPGYMAPELMLTPQSIDWRSDLFSLCAVLYEALTGQKPYPDLDLDYEPGRAPPAIQSIVSAANGDLMPLRELEPNIPVHVAAAIERGLQFDRARRFGSWEQFVRTLRGEARLY
jgi:hypothetical protein